VGLEMATSKARAISWPTKVKVFRAHYFNGPRNGFACIKITKYKGNKKTGTLVIGIGNNKQFESGETKQTSSHRRLGTYLQGVYWGHEAGNLPKKCLLGAGGCDLPARCLLWAGKLGTYLQGVY